MTATLSVVIPMLDEASTRPACLAAVAAQEGWPGKVELLAVDGGSTDDSRVVAEAAGAQVLEAPRGRGVQMRAGAEAAAGDVLMFLHADVRLPDGAFAAVAAALEQPGTVAGCYELEHEHGPDAGPITRFGLWLADWRSRTRRIPYGDQAIWCTTAAYRAVGGMPERPLMEDVAFAHALKRHGRLARLPLTVRTGARRFERAPIHTTVCWWSFPLLARLGVPPRTLARWYGRGC